MIRTRFLLRVVVKSDKIRIRNSFVNFAVLQTYFNIKGHLKVYRDYVVGDSTEDAKLWPTHYMGFKLGSYAQFLVSGLKEGQYSPEIVEKLETLGLESLDSKRDFGVYLKAMKVFKSIHGEEKMGRRFVVPVDDDRYDPEARGLKLGVWVKTIKHNQEKWPEYKEELEQLGVNIKKRRRVKIDDIIAALSNYYSIHGHFQIPVKYAVPLQDPLYPEEAWGLKIGLFLRYYREGGYVKHRDRFSSLIGEPLDAGNKTKLSFQQLFDALVVYRMIHGHLNVIDSYVIPSDDQRYPERVRGVSLGVIVRNVHLYRPLYWDALVTLGLDLGKRKVADSGFDKAYACLEAYKRVNGNLDVYHDYEVPANDPHYPEGSEGFRLGRLVAGIRSEGVYKEHREQLEALGFSYETVDRSLQYMNKVVAALTTYHKLHGSLDVPYSFVIASDDQQYPEETRGLRLGNVVYRYKRGKLKNKYSDRLQQMGLGASLRTSVHNDQLNKDFACLEAYKRINGHLDVHHKYEVPANDPHYPEGSEGFKLGKLVASIRYKGLYKEHREQLLALGFSYEAVDRQLQYINNVVAALTTYHKLHDSLDVPSTFVIAVDDDEYPKETRGLRLGYVVYCYKTGRLKNKYSDRLQQMGLEQEDRNSTSLRLRRSPPLARSSLQQAPM